MRDFFLKIIVSKKIDKSKLFMLEFIKLFEEIWECWYFCVGSNLRYIDYISYSSNICKCLVCVIKDKNKLKNYLSVLD